MLNKDGQRQLAYVVLIDDITSIEGYDRVELAHVGGWTVVVGKNNFLPGDPAIYVEIDSKLPEIEPFINMEFLAKKKFKIKTQKMCGVVSQGLLLSATDLGWNICGAGRGGIPETVNGIIEPDGTLHLPNDESRFLTEKLKITYYNAADRKRKAKPSPDAKTNSTLSRHPKIAKKYGKYIKKYRFVKMIFMLIFGRKKDNKTHFPTHFKYIKKTDQERCENMTWVLKDKTPFIVTEKCDGSSGTYILERKKHLFNNKYEFYVCSRNVRQLTPNQQSYYDENYYWECAIKYDIENKLKKYLKGHPELEYVCWQGEVCSPKIQKNPQKLSETHLFLFHMIDSDRGMYDIRDAIKIWEKYNMEYVPIINENYIFPDDFEDFKETANGFYSPNCCEGHTDCKREGFVYYKTTDPNFHFKNVSRDYLLKH